ncbi:hypothetical protein EDD72_101267 [Tepidibacillus fermentans]|uniref:Uncharacterized protein n=1 Tax=Tepidibacillus fermentans TaxID=1281767 RepID=A0A4R3KNJ5_9BACI|nr:hypothetical protein EDD72_101267 [Tepidibacillus fermentans]
MQDDVLNTQTNPVDQKGYLKICTKAEIEKKKKRLSMFQSLFNIYAILLAIFLVFFFISSFLWNQ